MQTAEFYEKIRNRDKLDRSSVSELQKLVQDFPYFQSAHLLLSLAAKKWDATVYQQSLKRTAIVVNNRTHLFNLIHEQEASEIKTVNVSAPAIKEPVAEVKAEIITPKEEAKQE